MTRNDAAALAAQLVRDGWREDDPGPTGRTIRAEDPVAWMALLDAVGAELAGRYLTHHDLSPAAVLDAVTLDQPGPMFVLDADAHREWRGLVARMAAGRDVAGAIAAAQNPDAVVADAVADVVGADLLAAIRQRARDLFVTDGVWTDGGDAARTSWTWDVGGALADLRRGFDALRAGREMSDDERARQRAALVGDAPSVVDYLAAQGWPSALFGFTRETGRRAKLTPEVTTPEGDAVVTVTAMRSTVIFPRGVMEGFAGERYWRRAGVVLDVRPPDLTTWELDALMAVLLAYSSRYGEGRWEGAREIPWDVLCDALGANSRRSKEARAIVDGLVALKGKQLLCWTHDPDGSRVASFEPILDRLAFVFDADDAGTVVTGWTGRAPRCVRVMLSAPMRDMGKNWIPADTVRQIRPAAKQIRGKRSALDGRLMIELVRVRRPRDGGGWESYVDRDALMKAVLGEATFNGYLSRRQYAKGIADPYWTAAAVLKRAGFVIAWTADRQTADGARDVFQLADPRG